jgi:hypothetical protein
MDKNSIKRITVDLTYLQNSKLTLNSNHCTCTYNKGDWVLFRQQILSVSEVQLVKRKEVFVLSF